MSLLNKLKPILIHETKERLPWAFVAYIGGILGYFLFEKASPLFVLLGFVLVSALIWFWVRRKEILSWGAMLTFFFLLGLTNITFHVALKQHPVLSHPLYQERIEASVLENRPLIEKQIVTLEKIRWQNPDLKMPARIRLHYQEKTPLLNAGDKIKAIVSVYPPSGAGAYNLWFQEIGATGVAQKIQVVESAPQPKLSFSKVRHKINQYIFQILPSSQAEIAAPLITGEQKLILQNTYQIYRRSGIAHVLSVSGFHMALLAAFLFLLIRGLCTFFPRIVFYYNSKKIASVVALIGTFLYLGLSGFQVPAIRAFIMISFVFFGILIDRSVLSMRSLLLAGLGMLLLMPQMIFSISFQLSFTAVAVLIMICNFVRQQPWGRFKKSFIGFLLLNICVFLALVPFILYHFHLLTPYGVLGNMVFSGAFSLFIMPLLFAGVLLMPFGVDKIFFIMSGLGLDVVRWCGEKISTFPYAERTVENFNSISLIFISFGIMLFCFMRPFFKGMGLILIVIGASVEFLS